MQQFINGGRVCFPVTLKFFLQQVFRGEWHRVKIHLAYVQKADVAEPVFNEAVTLVISLCNAQGEAEVQTTTQGKTLRLLLFRCVLIVIQVTLRKGWMLGFKLVSKLESLKLYSRINVSTFSWYWNYDIKIKQIDLWMYIYFLPYSVTKCNRSCFIMN